MDSNALEPQYQQSNSLPLPTVAVTTSYRSYLPYFLKSLAVDYRLHSQLCALNRRVINKTKPNKTNPNNTMAEPVTGGAKPKTSGKVIDWSELVPMAVDHEDAMNAVAVKNVWATMMKYAGLNAPDERLQAAFKLGVYAYACINGTSRVGMYEGKIVLADGKEVEASVIPRATGATAIRKFFRGTMDESYIALKTSGVIEKNPRMVAKAAKFGISAACAFAMADWLAGCGLFTPQESLAHEKVFNFSVRRASAARGGSLEKLEDKNLTAGIEAQEHLSPLAGHTIDF